MLDMLDFIQVGIKYETNFNFWEILQNKVLRNGHVRVYNLVLKWNLFCNLQMTEKHVAVYPNSGEIWDGESKRWLVSDPFRLHYCYISIL